MDQPDAASASAAPVISGLTLLEILRRRRTLAPAEVVRLLRDLPALLDATEHPLGALVYELRVEFLAPDANAETLARPLTDWPDFALRTRTHQRGGGSTILELGGAPGALAAPAKLAALICELLGGGRRDARGAVRVAPVAALGEEANERLRHAAGGRYVTCQAFWNEWEGAVRRAFTAETPAVAPREFSIPAERLGHAHPGELLRLVPAERTHPPALLVARSRFRIGRSPSLSDFPARLFANGVFDEEKTNLVSRVHVVAECGAGGITLRDGSGERPSANGSSFDGARLDPAIATPLERPGVLDLGGAFRLEILPVREPAAAWSIANVAAWRGPRLAEESTCAGRGAVVFLPLDRQPLSRDVAWLFSVLTFDVSGEGRLAWRTGAAGGTAWFVRRHGGFWLGNVALHGEPPRLGGISIAPGQIAPLAGGDVLEIGAARWTIEVE